MKRILIITLLSFLVAASLALAAEVFTPTVERPESESFVGYVPNRIVVNFNHSLTQRMEPKLFDQGRTGIAALDDVGTSHRVAAIKRKFKGAKKKKHKGREIDLAG